MQPVVAQTEWSNGLHKVTFTVSETQHFGDGGVARGLRMAQNFLAPEKENDSAQTLRLDRLYFFPSLLCVILVRCAYILCSYI